MRVVIRRAPDGKITFQEAAKIAIITINRPVARNALTKNMWQELGRIGELIPKNPKTRVVILRGITGNFTSGSDIKEFCNMDVDEANEAFKVMEKTIATFENLPIPVIGAIDGPALGAGFVLSLACDIRMGTPLVKMGIPVGKLGIKLGPSFIRRISALIGPSRTKELVFTNEIYDYKKSHSLGLLNRIVASQDLERDTIRLAHLISKQSRASLQAVKQSTNIIQASTSIPWDFVDPTDFPEGCQAFAEKREPWFI